LPGLGAGQICLGISVKSLVDDLSRISGLAKSVVEGIVEPSSLGIATKSPDPALQPFIPVGMNQVAVPAIFILSSNWERNLLSLHARVSPKTFNSASSVFERRMIDKVQSHLPAWI